MAVAVDRSGRSMLNGIPKVSAVRHPGLFPSVVTEGFLLAREKWVCECR